MTRTGRTLTKPLQVESKQHDLFNIDLGDGIPRRMLVAGMVLVAVWCSTLWLLIGPPSSQSSSLYLIPPVLLAYLGFQEDPRQPRRRRITQWSITVRYMTTGHRPVVRMGARSAYRSEYLPISHRARRVVLAFARYFPQLRDIGDESTVSAQPGAGRQRAGAPITLSHSAVLYGRDYMHELRQEKP